MGRNDISKFKHRLFQIVYIQEFNEYLIAQKNKKIEDKIISNLRRSLRKVIKNKNLKYQSKICDCSAGELRKHLESQFLPGMSWDNYHLFGWHIDHIKPIDWYKKNQPDKIYEANYWANLKPLWAKENLSKSNKYA